MTDIGFHVLRRLFIKKKCWEKEEKKELEDFSKEKRASRR